MIDVRYPGADFRVKKENNSNYIFDSIRKTWILLTEEEWVRQNFVNYLIKELTYPSTVIAVEKTILLNDLKKRFDILVYDKNHNPWMLIECKAPGIALSEDVLQQVLRYNVSVPVQFIVITNGKTTIGWEKIGTELKILSQLPNGTDYY